MKQFSRVETTEGKPAEYVLQRADGHHLVKFGGNQWVVDEDGRGVSPASLKKQLVRFL